ncbi:hypothetical protein [Ruminococcus sp. Marseille-P6503]|uniref:hypothetical protein n=1 Tax=Ruminococcus sp. Marseille-P6503 TaxID=2364796 RepID=UPI000F51D8F4|nr:hypothetical protein [Ruminococcus sp. Marseille-P6503]
MSSFSTVYSEYYYYCRISNVEEAQSKFICCNSILRDESKGTSLALQLFEDKYEEEKTKLYEKYKRIYDDFLSYSDALIDGKKIDSEEKYIRYIHNLMRISNEMIIFTNQYFVSSSNKLLKNKYDFDGKDKKLSYIINQNRNIPYIINSDLVDNFIDGNSNTIMFSLASAFLVIAITLGIWLYNSFAEAFKENTSFITIIINNFLVLVLFVCFAFLFIFYLVLLIKYKRIFKLKEVKYMAQRRNRTLVCNAFKTNWTMKNILNIMSMLKELK